MNYIRTWCWVYRTHKSSLEEAGTKEQIVIYSKSGQQYVRKKDQLSSSLTILQSSHSQLRGHMTPWRPLAHLKRIRDWKQFFTHHFIRFVNAILYNPESACNSYCVYDHGQKKLRIAALKFAFIITSASSWGNSTDEKEKPFVIMNYHYI